ncbi:MAG: hypothetical protein RQ752_11995 [Thermohalobaculum sp.]|nr:hypothetical protein [Thermohalobaculum sp.]
MTATDSSTAEILAPGTPGGEQARRVRGPGWISRNRAALAAARRLGATVVMVAPPPARIPLALACLAIDGALWAEEARRGARDDGAGLALGGAGLALEAVALAAAMASAPAALARHAPRILAARRILARIEASRR